MKSLSAFFLPITMLLVVFVSAPVPNVAGQAEQAATTQLYLPHAGRIMASPTPTLAGTETTSPTEVITATVTFSPTFTPTPTRTVTPTPTTSPTPSDTPTITPTPTRTGTPTTTPTVTPTPTDAIGDGVIVLNSHHAYLNAEGLVTVVGEVRNDTEFNATNMRVVVTLYNNRTDVVDTRETYVWIDVLLPGERSCFEVIFLGDPVYNRYEFVTSYSNTSRAPRPLVIVDHGAVYLPGPGAWNVFGQIGNIQEVGEGEEAEPLVYPQIIGTIYDEVGHVLDCMYINAEAESLAPGMTSIWQMTFRPLPQQEGMRYRVQAK